MAFESKVKIKILNFCLYGFMPGSRKFCQRVSISDSFFKRFFDEGRTESPYKTKSGPSRPTSEMPFKWGFADGLMIALLGMLAW